MSRFVEAYFVLHGLKFKGEVFIYMILGNISCKSEPVCFKLDIILDTIKLQYGSRLNELGLHSRSQGYRKDRLCVISLLLRCMRRVREMTSGKSFRYGKYGSFEHLLLLFQAVI